MPELEYITPITTTPIGINIEILPSVLIGSNLSLQLVHGEEVRFWRQHRVSDAAVSLEQLEMLQLDYIKLDRKLFPRAYEEENASEIFPDTD